MESKTLNETRAVAEQAVETLLGSLRVLDRDRAAIQTDDVRQRRESARSTAIAAAEPAVRALEAVIAAEQAAARANVHEVDRLRDQVDRLGARAEDLEVVLDLVRRSAGVVPMTGLTCDTDQCLGAIGIVGARQPSSSAACVEVDEAMLTIALACGWKVVDGHHLCPVCVQQMEDKQ
jgi:hypothetical protein